MLRSFQVTAKNTVLCSSSGKPSDGPSRGGTEAPVGCRDGHGLERDTQSRKPGVLW